MAGQQIVLDELAWSGNNWPYWRLYDPFGNQIHESYFYSDSATLTLARTGTYVLAIEGQIDQRGSTTPSFQVHLAGTVTPPAGQSRITAPGGRRGKAARSHRKRHR